MARLQGIISDITFQNEDSGFTVLRLQTDTDHGICTCVGTLPTVTRGESIAVEGDWGSHKKFGPQFLVTHYEIIRPTTITGIEQLLGSGLFSNIGPVRARKIIETFGIQTLDILDKKPDRLGEVPGIGRKDT